MLEYINAGLIGYGYAGKTLHAPLLRSVPGIRLQTIVSRDKAKVKNDLPHVNHVATTDELLADPGIDLVVIATPNDTHYPLARAALLAGKHVVIDKPFSLDSREARALIALAQEQDLLLSVFHNRRWDADFLTLKTLLQQGELGEVLHLESHFDRYRPEVRDRWREQAVPGSGLWYDLGAHLIDQTLQLFGQPETLWLDLAEQRPGARTDDYFHAILQYGQKRVVLHASTQVVDHGPRYIVHGSQGSYRKYGLDVQETQLQAGMTPTDSQFGLDPRPGMLLTADGEDEARIRQQSIGNQRGDYCAFYTQMAEAIRRGTPVPVNPEEALQVMELIELGLRSTRESRRLPVGAQHLDSLVTQAQRHPAPTAPLSASLGNRQAQPQAASRQTTPQASPPRNVMNPRPLATTPPAAAPSQPVRPVTSVPQTPTAAVPSMSGRPAATSSLTSRAAPLASPISQPNRPVQSLTPRAAPTNFRSPSPHDRQILKDKQQTPGGVAADKKEPVFTQTAQPAAPSPFRPAGNQITAEPPKEADIRRKPFFAEPPAPPATGHRSPIAESLSAGSAFGSGADASRNDQRREPSIGTIRLIPTDKTAEPKLSSSPFVATSRPTRDLSLPHMSVNDGDGSDDDDLPPFSAS